MGAGNLYSKGEQYELTLSPMGDGKYEVFVEASADRKFRYTAIAARLDDAKECAREIMEYHGLYFHGFSIEETGDE
jgi:Ni,Fe-hydrogenase III component G